MRKFSTDVLDWKVENGQQAMNVLSSMFNEEINAVFQLKLSLIDIEKDKKLKNSPLSPIFFSIIIKLSIIILSRALNPLNNEQTCCFGQL